MITNPVEKVIAESLDAVGVKFIFESENKSQGLDFYLPDFDCYIECKEYHTERTGKQIQGKQVILIQGRQAAETFRQLLKVYKPKGQIV